MAFRLFLISILICLACTPVYVQKDRLRAENRASLNRLEVGMNKKAVLGVMGSETRRLTDFAANDVIITNPYRTSMLSVDSMPIEILYYYTDEKKHDGVISDDELTPIVLINNRLVGWGWDYWHDTATKYEIRIR